MYEYFTKPFLDFTISLLVFILLFPLFLTVFLLLTIANRGPALFFHARPGKKGKVFKVIKFKTMKDSHDSQGNLLQSIDRITPIGKFIRATSLDEIPQLINVIKGDMSIVGPRPLHVEYLLLYNDFQKRRHEVKPGITGWAQVNGRNTISWEQKFEYDVWYVDHCSFSTDFKILLKTIEKVFKREGVNQSGQATMPYFKGTPKS